MKSFEFNDKKFSILFTNFIIYYIIKGQSLAIAILKITVSF